MRKQIARLKQLEQEERKREAEILRLLQEIQRSRIYAEMGYSSLFTFCTKEIGYTDAAAYRRIEAMKLCTRAPEAVKQIESGALTVTNACLINRTLTEAKKVEIEISQEQLLAAVLHTGTREAERRVQEIASARGLGRSPAEDQAFQRKKAELLAWLSHRHPGLSDEGLFRLLVEEAHEKLNPENKPANFRAEVRQPLRRHVPAPLRRAIWKRDGGRCTYQDPSSGRLCGSTHFLELDHIQPFAKGGRTTASNLRLYCRTHNRLHAEREGLLPSAPKYSRRA